MTRISAIIKGNRRVTADTALRFSKYFGNSAKFWLGLQDDFDIEEYMEDAIIAGLPQTRGHVTYMWNGIMLFNMSKIKNKKTC